MLQEDRERTALNRFHAYVLKICKNKRSQLLQSVYIVMNVLARSLCSFLFAIITSIVSFVNYAMLSCM